VYGRIRVGVGVGVEMWMSTLSMSIVLFATTRGRVSKEEYALVNLCLCVFLRLLCLVWLGCGVLANNDGIYHYRGCGSAPPTRTMRAFDDSG
jgi:hypothetical protein